MFDYEIVMDSLQKIRKAIETIEERSSVVDDPNELLCSPGGMMRLDAICMSLIALGEALKGLEKQTHGELLSHYPIGMVQCVCATRLLITISRSMLMSCSVLYRKTSLK